MHHRIPQTPSRFSTTKRALRSLDPLCHSASSCNIHGIEKQCRDISAPPQKPPRGGGGGHDCKLLATTLSCHASFAVLYPQIKSCTIQRKALRLTSDLHPPLASPLLKQQRMISTMSTTTRKLHLVGNVRKLRPVQQMQQAH